MSRYVYLKSKSGLDVNNPIYCESYIVGFYKPTGEWELESQHATSEKAAERVSFLNGHKTRTEMAAGALLAAAKAALAAFEHIGETVEMFDLEDEDWPEVIMLTHAINEAEGHN